MAGGLSCERESSVFKDRSQRHSDFPRGSSGLLPDSIGVSSILWIMVCLGHCGFWRWANRVSDSTLVDTSMGVHRRTRVHFGPCIECNGNRRSNFQGYARPPRRTARLLVDAGLRDSVLGISLQLHPGDCDSGRFCFVGLGACGSGNLHLHKAAHFSSKIQEGNSPYQLVDSHLGGLGNPRRRLDWGLLAQNRIVTPAET